MEQTSEMESSEVGDQTWKTLICSYITFKNLNFVSLNDKILRLHFYIEIARFALPQRVCLRLIYVNI